MLAELWAWWLQQMRDVLPRRLFAGARYADAILLRPDGVGLTAALRRRGIESRLGPIVPGGGAVLRRLRGRQAPPVLLCLPPSTLLQQPASLPLAAERDLGAVLRHEMDRLTPFRAEDLFWAWRIDARDRVAGRLKLRLLLVPKRAVAASLAALSEAGLQPAALEIASGKTLEYLPLTPPGEAGRGRTGASLAGVACAVLAVAVCAVPVVRQERAIARAEDAVEASRPRIAQVDALRRRLAANTSGADLFTAESARFGSLLRALAAVTTALPDDTYLTGFTLRDRSLSLTGRSAAAVKLIGLLSADPDLRNPAFDAPVTRIGEKSDLFSIRATLAP